MGNLKKPINNVQNKREEPYGKNTERNFYRDLDERDQHDKIPVKTNWQDATRRYADNYIKNPNDMKNYDENRNFSGERRSRGNSNFNLKVIMIQGIETVYRTIMI